MKTLRVLPEAEEELAQAAEWYEAKRIGLGVELVAIVDRAFNEVQDAPLLYALWRTDWPYRHKVLTRFPYVISFAPTVTRSRSSRSPTAKRRPGFWLVFECVGRNSTAMSRERPSDLPTHGSHRERLQGGLPAR